MSKSPPPDPRNLWPWTLPAPPGLVRCDEVLDIGAGVRPQRWYRPQRHVCVEPYRPYADILVTHGYTVYVMTALEFLTSCVRSGARYEAVYLLDVLEHMERAEGRRVLELVERVARRQVVIYTPIGFKPQTTDNWGLGGHHWQTHRSGWTPEEFIGWATSIPELQGAGGKTTREGFFAVRTK